MSYKNAWNTVNRVFNHQFSLVPPISSNVLFVDRTESMTFGRHDDDSRWCTFNKCLLQKKSHVEMRKMVHLECLLKIIAGESVWNSIYCGIQNQHVKRPKWWTWIFQFGFQNNKKLTALNLKIDRKKYTHFLNLSDHSADKSVWQLAESNVFKS